MNTQTLTFSAKRGDALAENSRTITLLALPGQLVGDTIIGSEKITVSLDEDGIGDARIVQGVKYRVLIPWWGAPVTITATDDAVRTFAAYVAELTLGSFVDSDRIVAKFLTASDGTQWQLIITENGDGTFSQQYMRVA